MAAKGSSLRASLEHCLWFTGVAGEVTPPSNSRGGEDGLARGCCLKTGQVCGESSAPGTLRIKQKGDRPWASGLLCSPPFPVLLSTPLQFSFFWKTTLLTISQP